MIVDPNLSKSSHLDPRYTKCAFVPPANCSWPNRANRVRSTQLKTAIERIFIRINNKLSDIKLIKGHFNPNPLNHQNQKLLFQ